MSDNSLISKTDLIELIQDQLNEQNLTPETELESLEGWDSMGVLLIMAEYDERFNITLSEDHLNNMKIVNDLVSIVDESGFLIA